MQKYICKACVIKKKEGRNPYQFHPSFLTMPQTLTSLTSFLTFGSFGFWFGCVIIS